MAKCEISYKDIIVLRKAQRDAVAMRGAFDVPFPPHIQEEVRRFDALIDRLENEIMNEYLKL